MTMSDAIFLSIGLIGLWVAWFLLWKNYYLDRCRCQLFNLRHELFQAAVAGEIGFDSPAYQMLRMLLNGMIRFNHRFTLVTLFLTSRHARPEGFDNIYSRWALHVNRLSPEAKKHIEAIHFRAHVTVLQYMASRSLILKLVYLGYVLKALSMRGITAVRATSRDAMARDIKLDRLERDVYISQEYESKVGLVAA